MPRVLHLLTGDASGLALSVIGTQSREPGTQVTVVLLDGAAEVPLPAGVALRRLGNDLDHSALLDLIFESDQVVTW